MGYKNERTGRWANTEDVVLLGSEARTATTNGEWFDVGDAHTLRLLLDVTARSGTSPTCDVSVQTRKDADDASPRTVGSFAQKTAAGSERKAFTGLDRQVRVVQTLGGTTPSFTSSVSGELVG